MKTAICCIAKDEDQYLDEFVQYHWKLGIDDVFVLENNWRYQGDLPEKYNHLGEHHMYLYPFDGEVKQLDAYNLFLQSFSQMYDWCAFIDVDEFICLRDSTKSFKEILEEFKAFPSLAINWRLFGSSGLKYDGRSDVVTRFTKCSKNLNMHVKQLVNLKMMRENGIMSKVCFTTPHCGNWAAANLQKNAVIGPFNTQHLDQVQPLELNHYAVKTWDECLAKCSRGRADASCKRNAEEFFREHDKNEVDNTVAKDFYLSK